MKSPVCVTNGNCQVAMQLRLHAAIQKLFAPSGFGRQDVASNLRFALVPTFKLTAKAISSPTFCQPWSRIFDSMLPSLYSG